MIDSLFPSINPSDPFTLEVIIALGVWLILGLALEITHLMPRLHRLLDAIVLIIIALIMLYIYNLHLTGSLHPERIQAVLFRVAPYAIAFFLGVSIANLIVLIVKRQTKVK